MAILFKTTNSTFDFTYNGVTEVTSRCKTGQVGLKTNPT